MRKLKLNPSGFESKVNVIHRTIPFLLVTFLLINFSNNLNGQQVFMDSGQSGQTPDMLTVSDNLESPVIINIENFDLALRKTASPTNVNPGGLIHFEIEVFNQGSIPAGELTIVDYLPAGITAEDAAWELDPYDPSKVLYTASIDNGRLPMLGLTGYESVVISLTCRLSEDAPFTYYTNRAEIKAAYDLFGNNLGIYDEDSFPDDDPSNDAGGLVNTPTDDQIDDDGSTDEDDADPAQVYVTSVVLTEGCNCLNNATSPDNGEFTDTWVVRAPAGQNWTVLSVNGISDLNPGDPLSEVMGFNGYSTFSITGTHLDGQGYAIEFINDLGDTESYSRPAGSCNYQAMRIKGPRGTCGQEEVYSIANPDPEATYQWQVTGLANTFVGPDTGTEVIVMWGEPVGNTFELSVTNTGTPNCQAPSSVFVQIGSPSGSFVSRDELTASVDQHCEVEITALMILTAGYNPDGAYSIVLTTPDGEKLPSNVITSDYLYMPLLAELTDLCGGNYATTIVTAIDKFPPVLDCSDEVVACDQLDSWTGPTVYDACDPDAQAILVDEVITNENCYSEYSQQIVQTYVAVDASGNQSQPCVKTIYIERANTEEVQWPKDHLVVENSALICGAYPMCPVCPCDTFPYPDPLATGVPMLNGQPLYPSSLGHCQFLVSFTDVVMINTPCHKSIARYWSVHEICDSYNIFNIINYRQDIEIIDNNPPIPVAPENIEMTTDGENCGNMVQLPALEITDNCSTLFKVDITYPGGFIEDSNGASVWLPEGENTIVYKIYDECNNNSQVEMTVTIEDQTAPVAICQSNTTVTLTNDGFAEVPASVFNNGSYDDCDLENMEVRRMEDGNSCGLTQNEFGPMVTFCCEDVGNPVVVVLRVWDGNENWNECMVEVEVQDITAPVLTVPQDREIECTDYYDLEDLSMYGTASVYDVCGYTLTEDYDAHIDQCGVGYIDRIFTASDGMTTVTKSQRIYVVNSSPYQWDDIDWPDDYMTAASCSAGDLAPANLPDGYSFPILNNEDQCDMLGFTYSDVIFPIEEEGNACYKVVRTWKVMDMCQLVEGEFRTWYWDQLIKVINTNDPDIVSDLTPVETCTYDVDCEDGFIELQFVGDDDCTPVGNLYWDYQIDLNKDGVIDDEGTYIGEILDLSGTYDIGEHIVYIILADFCGNSTYGAREFTIINCKKPTAVCIESLAIAIQATDLDGDGIPDTEQAYIEAEEFDGGSYHSCGYPLTYSFSIDTSDYFMYVDCEDVSATGITITLYVTDIYGHYDYCETTLFVQDNNDDEICDNFRDCVVYPEGELFIDSCDPDLSPEALESEVTISGDCPCQDYEITFVDLDISDPSNTCTTIQRDWSIYLNCEPPRHYTFQQIIEIINTEAPQLVCVEQVEADNTGDCEGYVSVPVPTYEIDGCNTGIFITHDSPYADTPTGPDASGTYPVGVTAVTFTLEDECGNQSQCTIEVVVIDVTPPVCAAQDITVTLGADGTYNLTPEEVDGGSTDDCGVDYLEVQPNFFDCEDIGENTVTVTVFDLAGNSSTCTAVVTVEDGSGELCSTQDIDIILDGNGMYSLDPEEIYTGSSCGGLNVDLEVVPNSFTCDDLGENVVTLTVTESNGNQETCEAIVTVSDTIAPVCSLLDLDVYLDENGLVAVGFDDINDGSFDPCGTVIDTVMSNTSWTCDDVGEQTVTITFTDDSGNVSVCESTVTVHDDIAPVCLANDITVQIESGGSVTISAFDVDGGSYDNCGLSTIIISPNTFTCEDIGENEVTITVVDVNGLISSCTAIVTVEDDSGPLCSTQDIEIILDGNGNYILEPEEIYTGSPCGGGDVTLEVDPNTFDCDDIGENTVTLTVTDQFGNQESCTAIVTVTDTIAPVCNVMDYTAYLDGNGQAVIGFSDLDDGSDDPCGFITLVILSNNSFNCADIGDNIVTVTLVDNSGNLSTCEATVTVVDTIAPVCVTEDIVVELDLNGNATITASQIDDGSFDECSGVTLSVEPNSFDCDDVGFVTVVLTVTDDSGNSSLCSATVEVVDILPPEITCPADTTISCNEWPIADYSVFGEATATDACGMVSSITETVIESVNVCGIGIITRNFTATDNSGNQSSCTQIINIIQTDLIFSEENIFWGPDLIETDNCADLDPAFLGGQPNYFLDNVDCFILSETYSDIDLNPDNQCPDTISRVWTVIDSCQFDAGTGEGIWTFNQTLVIIDEIPPVIHAPPDTTVCGEGYISLMAWATDCGIQEGVDAHNDSNFADSQMSADASGDYIVGEYDITITANDACGNESVYTYHLIVLDEFGECFKIVRYMDDNGMVILHIDEIFVQNTECFDTNTVKFSLDINDITKDTLHFNCDDLGDLTSVDIPIPIFRWENGQFIEEYCDGTLTLQDPDNFCDESGFAGISGKVFTFDGRGIVNTEVLINGSEEAIVSTGENGEYAFPIVSANGNYLVDATKNDDVLNGLSTLDLIHIQRHVLGIQPFDEATQYIAADVNNSRAISAGDIFELRNLLLGVRTAFSNNDSWRFMPADYEFINPDNPLLEEIPEYVVIEGFNGNAQVNFKGVKIGDVNGSYDPGSGQIVDGRIQNPVELVALPENARMGELVNIPVLLNETAYLNGLQFTFEFDPELYDFIDIEGDNLNVSNQNYGISRAKLGLISFSWHDLEPMLIEEGTNLFNIRLVAKNNAPFALFSMSDAILSAEWYENEQDIRKISCRFGIKEPFTLYQNTPNPWSNTTEFVYKMPESGVVHISVRNIYGSLVKRYDVISDKGFNTFVIQQNDFSESGLLIFEIEYNGVTETRKMIKIN
jgi:uncharacterized repeat protein (TIGR01451 family)